MMLAAVCSRVMNFPFTSPQRQREVLLGALTQPRSPVAPG
jgi:hypothetical protein